MCVADEIRDMPLPLQDKLLRALEERRLRALGSHREMPFDVRIIAADDPSELLPLEEIERRYIARVIHACDGNESKAARILGIGRKTLYRHLEHTGLPVSDDSWAQAVKGGLTRPGRECSIFHADRDVIRLGEMPSTAAAAEDVAAPELRVPRAPAVVHASNTAELLLSGGASVLLLPACWSLQRVLGLDSAELAVGFVTFYAAYVINDPHFAVTYLLFYRDIASRTRSPAFSRAQRLRYVAAGFVAPILLALWAVSALATRSAASLGLMTQLMFLLVGWHYVKQGFGVVTVLSARRGTSYDANERRALLVHAFAGWAYAWSSPFDPGRLVEEKGVIYSTLAHPTWLEPVTRGAFFVSAVPLALVLLRKWRRNGALPLAPLSGFLVSVWLWTVYSGIDPLFMYLIPALHSLQYLYFVWLMKRNQARANEGPPSFGRPVAVVVGSCFVGAVLLGVALFHLLPSALDSALIDARAGRLSPLGATPYFAALFTFVNLHHYFMDAVLWRRDNPETRYLRN